MTRITSIEQLEAWNRNPDTPKGYKFPTAIVMEWAYEHIFDLLVLDKCEEANRLVLALTRFTEISENMAHHTALERTVNNLGFFSRHSELWMSCWETFMDVKLERRIIPQ